MVRDNHDDIIGCIKNMVALAKAGQVMSLEFWLCESHVQLAVLEMLMGTEPVFGADGQDELEELCNNLHDLAVSLGAINRDEMRGPVSNALLMMLLEVLVKWLAEQASSGELLKMLLELIEQLRRRD